VKLVEKPEISLRERVRRLKQEINEAWDDPRPSLPADEVFDEIMRGEDQGGEE
jgi:hypothetical protein